jgi:hypothetical protein
MANYSTAHKRTIVAAVFLAALIAYLPGPVGGVEVTYVGAISGGFSAPTSLDASADQIAVLQPYRNQVLLFSPGGVITRRIDIEGDARGLARLFASVYVYCDRDLGVVKAVDLSDGRQWVFLDSFEDPADIVVTGDGCHVLDSSMRRVVSADFNGTVTARLDLEPSNGDVALALTSLAFDGTRNAFHVFNQYDSRVHVFDRSGQ